MRLRASACCKRSLGGQAWHINKIEFAPLRLPGDRSVKQRDGRGHEHDLARGPVQATGAIMMITWT